MHFQRACMERLNLLPPTGESRLEMLINELLREMVELEQITEASEDTTVTGRFNELVEERTRTCSRVWTKTRYYWAGCGLMKRRARSF